MFVVFIISCRNTKPEHNKDIANFNIENSEELQINTNNNANEKVLENVIPDEIKKFNILKEYKIIKISEGYEVQFDTKNIQFPWHMWVKPFSLPPNLPVREYTQNFECYYIRPPYSNNAIPLIARGEDKDGYPDEFYSIYNISENTFRKIKADDYMWLFQDTDRGGTWYSIFSPEWTLIITTGGMILLDSDSNRLVDNLEDLYKMVLQEFQNTVFDNEYILETIRQINNTGAAIITRYGSSLRACMDLSDGNGDEIIYVNRYKVTNAPLYLLKRLEKYFNIEIYKNFIPEEPLRSSLMFKADIYDNGFYIHDAQRLVLFDLKEHKVTEYIFDQNLSELTGSYYNFFIYFLEGSKEIYIDLYDVSPSKRFSKIFKYSL